jgi:signal transduction histidine kinase
MADDKINEKLEVEGEDELSTLATAFNELSERFTVIEKQRTEFVSNASHELKTPLSSIKLMADSIIQTPDIDMDYVREFLTDMNEEVERLNRIVNKLLYITKLDTLTETMSGSLELINLKDVVTGTHKNLLPIAEMEEKELVVNAKEDILIMANKDILWQAVYNIADNALKYTGDEGRVEISLVKEKKRAVISVKDNGVGISSEDVNRIFDRFYRVDKARSRETGGTGLGLSIAQSAVEFHNGAIEVESTPGEGSEFKIILPLVEWL